MINKFLLHQIFKRYNSANIELKYGIDRNQ